MLRPWGSGETAGRPGMVARLKETRAAAIEAMRRTVEAGARTAADHGSAACRGILAGRPRAGTGRHPAGDPEDDRGRGRAEREVKVQAQRCLLRRWSRSAPWPRGTRSISRPERAPAWPGPSWHGRRHEADHGAGHGTGSSTGTHVLAPGTGTSVAAGKSAASRVAWAIGKNSSDSPQISRTGRSNWPIAPACGSARTCGRNPAMAATMSSATRRSRLIGPKNDASRCGSSHSR